MREEEEGEWEEGERCARRAEGKMMVSGERTMKGRTVGSGGQRSQKIQMGRRDGMRGRLYS